MTNLLKLNLNIVKARPGKYIAQMVIFFFLALKSKMAAIPGISQSDSNLFLKVWDYIQLMLLPALYSWCLHIIINLTSPFGVWGWGSPSIITVFPDTLWSILTANCGLFSWQTVVYSHGKLWCILTANCGVFSRQTVVYSHGKLCPRQRGSGRSGRENRGGGAT